MGKVYWYSYKPKGLKEYGEIGERINRVCGECLVGPARGKKKEVDRQEQMEIINRIKKSVFRD